MAFSTVAGRFDPPRSTDEGEREDGADATDGDDGDGHASREQRDGGSDGHDHHHHGARSPAGGAERAVDRVDVLSQARVGWIGVDAST
jgi:hypothetical protein